MAAPALERNLDLIEPRVERVGGYPSFNKKVLPFDASQEQQRKHGRRHLRTIESSAFLLDYLEGRLDANHQIVAKDMISDNGEWLNDACSYDRKTNSVIYYFDVRGLEYDYANAYSAKGLQFSERAVFPLPNRFTEDMLRSHCFVKQIHAYEFPLWMLDDAHVRCLYGRSYKELPQKMREGLAEAVVQVPQSSGIVWPLSRGGYSSGGKIGRNLAYSVACTIESNHQFRASRGITDTARKGQGIAMLELVQRKEA